MKKIKAEVNNTHASIEMLPRATMTEVQNRDYLLRFYKWTTAIKSKVFDITISNDDRSTQTWSIQIGPSPSP